MNANRIQKVRESFQNAMNTGPIGEHRELGTLFRALWPEIHAMLRKGHSLKQISEIWQANGLENQDLPVRMLIQMVMLEKTEKNIDEVNELLGLAASLVPKGPCCLHLDSRIKPLAPRADAHQDTYKIGVMEHPAIPGLMLTLEERLYGALLIYRDANGQIQEETAKQKLFRMKWQKPVPAWEP